MSVGVILVHDFYNRALEEIADEGGYADHCHLCYESRCALIEHFPDVLPPDQMYGNI